MQYPWHLYLMGAMYIIAGIMHFIRPAMYKRIMPRYLPDPGNLIYLSGIAEIVLGIAVCIPQTKDYAIWGIIAMLAVFLLVHVHMLSSKKAGAGFPQWALVIRLFLQFGLMYWAYHYLQF